jgi:hypothetical protein
MKNRVFLLSFVTISLMLVGIISQANAITNQESKDKIITAINRAVEGNWSNIDVFSISKYNNDNTEVVINDSKPIDNQTQPPKCKPDQHLENGVCVPNVHPSGNVTNVVMAGDFSCSSSVIKSMKNENPKLFVGLGDLCYQSSLSGYKAAITTLGDIQKCVIGNHESKEDGSASIEQEAKVFCGDYWYQKVNDNTLVVGFNSNDLAASQPLQQVVTNNEIMNGIENLIVTSHKPCVSVPPNSHHGIEIEVKQFCTDLKSKIPDTVKVYYIDGHNHVYSISNDGLLIQVGTGGRSHYGCGTDSTWIYCNDKDYGFLKLEIDNDNGNIKTSFIGTNGVVIH